MLNKIEAPPLTPAAPPPAAFHFLVVFFGIGPAPIPNPLDVRFQRVSGIGLSIPSDGEMKLGSRMIQLPGKPQYSPLTLERGHISGSIIRKELEFGLANLQFSPKTILIMLMNGMGIPVANWLFFDAYPTSWTIGNLDANQSELLIETMVFSYSSFQSISL